MKPMHVLIVVANLTLAGWVASPRPTSQSAAAAQTDVAPIPHDLSAGQAKLAAQVYRRLAEQAGVTANLFVSPLSLSEGLGLAVLGGRPRRRFGLC